MLSDEELDKIKVKAHWVYLGPDFKPQEDGSQKRVKNRKNCIKRSERVRQLSFLDAERFPASPLAAQPGLHGV